MPIDVFGLMLFYRQTKTHVMSTKKDNVINMKARLFKISTVSSRQ